MSGTRHLSGRRPLLATLAVLGGGTTLALLAPSSAQAAGDGCHVVASRSGDQLTLHQAAADCAPQDVQVSTFDLPASYQGPGDKTYPQVLRSTQAVHLDAGTGRVTITLDVPECGFYQWDVYAGAPYVPGQPYPHFDNGSIGHAGSDDCATPSPTTSTTSTTTSPTSTTSTSPTSTTSTTTSPTTASQTTTSSTTSTTTGPTLTTSTTTSPTTASQTTTSSTTSTTDTLTTGPTETTTGPGSASNTSGTSTTDQAGITVSDVSTTSGEAAPAGELAYTGTDLRPAAAGAGLLALGTAFVVGARRRPARAHRRH
ncbi:hypothetical protein [Angustibacter aerolatus]